MNKNTVIFGVLASLLILGGAFWASSEGDDSSEANSSSSASVVEQAVQGDRDFELNVDLAPLAQGTYEGWVVQGDDKLSTGLFNVDEDGEIVGDLSLDGITPKDGDTFAISIEPDNDTDPEPSATIVLAGEISSDGADLAFPVDTSAFSGSYILATPTDGNMDQDETAGVWFLSLESGSPALGLNLPDAPDGWIYEGWVVANGDTPLSTGKFVSAAGADDFDGYSGTAADAPPFPGEDLLQNLPAGVEAPYDIADGATPVVISIEPYQNGSDPTGDGPAQVKPLSATPAAGATDHSTFDLTLDASVPSGSVAF